MKLFDFDGNNPSLEEANVLYIEYMRARSVNVSETFASLDEVRDFILSEIRREFYAEGLCFMLTNV